MTTFDAGVICAAHRDAGSAASSSARRCTGRSSATRPCRASGSRSRRKRSTRGRELLAAPFFVDLSTAAPRSAQEFLQSVASQMEMTFNWLYADDRDIAQFTSGRLPQRPATVDPGLLTKGTGEFEWQGFVPAAEHRPGDQPEERRDPELEQQARARLRCLRHRMVVGPGPACRPAVAGGAEASDAHARLASSPR